MRKLFIFELLHLNMRAVLFGVIIALAIGLIVALILVARQPPEQSLEDRLDTPTLSKHYVFFYSTRYSSVRGSSGSDREGEIANGELLRVYMEFSGYRAGGNSTRGNYSCSSAETCRLLPEDALIFIVTQEEAIDTVRRWVGEMNFTRATNNCYSSQDNSLEYRVCFDEKDTLISYTSAYLSGQGYSNWSLIET